MIKMVMMFIITYLFGYLHGKYNIIDRSDETNETNV